MAKTTEAFKSAIEEHLKFRGFSDPLFAETLKKPNKNIDDCVKYILNQVQKSKTTGFHDDEIYNMAIHYYDEDNIEVGGDFNGQVVVNYKPVLTSDEIAEAKQKAIEQVINEKKAEMLKKKKKPQLEVVKDKKDVPKQPDTLF